MTDLGVGDMKFIHCGDIHLDSKMESNLSSFKAKERKTEILNTFERMVEFGKNEGVRGIIIAGDMFDSSRVYNQTKSRILNIINKYSEIDFLYLSGNHDKNFLLQLDVFPENLKVFGSEWTCFDYGQVKITGAVLNSENSDSLYQTLKLNEDDTNIVALHGQIASYNSKNKGEFINLPKLKNRNIDYLALGHIHNFVKEKLDKRGIYCYCGCLEGRGFDECGEKGFVLVDIENEKVFCEFIPFAKRKLIEVEFDITDYQNWFDIEDDLIKRVDNIDKENLIKIVLKGKYNLKLEKHISMLEKKLENFYFVKVKDSSTLEVKLEDVENDISLRGEFIRGVLSSNLSDKAKEQVILTGVKALYREEL